MYTRKLLGNQYLVDIYDTTNAIGCFSLRSKMLLLLSMYCCYCRAYNWQHNRRVLIICTFPIFKVGGASSGRMVWLSCLCFPLKCELSFHHPGMALRVPKILRPKRAGLAIGLCRYCVYIASILPSIAVKTITFIVMIHTHYQH